MQYIPSGVYLARVKVKDGGRGIVKRASLETAVFTTAKLRLPDKINEMRKPKAAVGTFADGRSQFERQTNSDHTLAELSRVYRLRCVTSILKSWPGLDDLKVDSIKEQQVRDWAQRYAKHFAPNFFNNSLNVLRQVFALAGLSREANHAFKIKRLGIQPTTLDLPTTDKFENMLALIETSGAAQARDCADLVRFLSFTGCRVSEMKQVAWQDVDWQSNEITIHCAQRRRTSSSALTRTVPMIPALRQLLEKLRHGEQPQPDKRICKLSECQKSLTRACRLAGCARLTHHSLRHLFATRCVESGIDIPTVARWLGHSDGGMVALKIYGHLRREHSQNMAAKVTFGAAPI